MTAQFIWYELMTTNLETSAAFFAELLDGEVLRTDDVPPSYFVAPKGTESPLFGLVPIESGKDMRSHWIGYLMVDDLDATIAATEEAGGVVHALADEAQRGNDVRFAIVTDGQGAVINLHDRVAGSPAEMPGAGRVAWIELLTNDREAATDYYQAITGWQVGPEHARNDEGVAHGLFNGPNIIGLLRDQPAGSPVGPSWTFYLRVDDLDEAIKKARALGAFLFEDPATVDGGRRVLLMDPTGAPVALWAAQ